MAFDLDAALAEAVRLGASDLHVKVPAAPRVRIEGELIDIAGSEPLTPADTDAIAQRLLGSALKREQFERHGYADLSYFVDSGRFRVAAFQQRGSASFVFRAIPEAPGPDGLRLPDVVLSWAAVRRGLVIVTGPTGAGKSTTNAVLIGLVNRQRACHIVTIEDPIEFLHRDDRALVSQRELGLDASSNVDALRATLRQDPDVILLGEIRDEDTAMTALRAAETGHLVFSTMHTSDAPETVERFLGLFENRYERVARQTLATTLTGIVSQRLVPGADGRRRLNAEVLVNTARVRDMIVTAAPHSDLHKAVAEGDYYGMRTFDQDLLALVREGAVTEEEAILHASAPHDLKLMLAGTNNAPRTVAPAAR